MSDPTLSNPAFHQAILRDLIEMGADLARRVHAAATQGAAAEPANPEAAAASAAPAATLEAATIAFDRIARTVRRTIALANHLETTAPRAGAQLPARRTTARTNIIRGVEDAIHRRRNDRDVDAAGLYAELNERLNDPVLDLDIDSRPVEDIIEEICRDLGVAVQARSWVWKRRTPAEIATLRTRAAASTKDPAPPHLHLVPKAAPNHPRRE